MEGPEDLKAAEVKNLHWLISSPKVHQVVIGEDGFPAAMSAPILSIPNPAGVFVLPAFGWRSDPG